MKRRNQARDILNAVKAGNRADEIRLHGRPVNRHLVVRNRKKYTRKLKHIYREYIGYEDI